MRQPPPDPRRARSGEAGFSLLETLIAAAVLMLILIGILPLFERSRLNLVQGNDSMRFSNAAIDSSERLLSLPFNGFATEITAGDFREDTDFWLLDGDQWTATLPLGDRAQYTRSTRTTQYSVADVTDWDATIFENRLPAGTAPGQIHFKRFVTEIENPRALGNDASVFRVVAIQTF